MRESGRSGLGDFLRSRREQLTPEAVGLPAGRRRRTPGLRREEVAECAGIGIDWYIRLEQGRAVTPSVTTIEALARALRLDERERQHLRALARDTGRPAFMRETAPATLCRLIDGLDQPAYVTGQRLDILAANAAAAALFGHLGGNVLTYLLVEPAARRLFGVGWAQEAKRVVARFRTAYDLWAGDPAFEELRASLQGGCREFAGWWRRHDIGRERTGTKTLDHPVQGRLAFEHASFQASDDPRLTLTIYTPLSASPPRTTPP